MLTGWLLQSLVAGASAWAHLSSAVMKTSIWQGGPQRPANVPAGF